VLEYKSHLKWAVNAGSLVLFCITIIAATVHYQHNRKTVMNIDNCYDL